MSEEKIVYLIRHPHTQVVPAVPSVEWGLSERGESQLQDLMRLDLWNSVRHTFTSSERKASSVGEMAFQRHGTPWSSHGELNELRRPWIGFDEYSRAVAEAFRMPGQAADGWESIESGFNRVKSLLLQTVANGSSPVAVVSHGLVLSALRAGMLGQKRVNFEQWRSLPFAAVAKVDIGNWKILSDFTAVIR